MQVLEIKNISSGVVSFHHEGARLTIARNASVKLASSPKLKQTLKGLSDHIEVREAESEEVGNLLNSLKETAQEMGSVTKKPTKFFGDLLGSVGKLFS